MSATFTFDDLRELGIPSRPQGPLFSHPDHGLDTHNWHAYLSSRGRFEAGSRRSREVNFLKTCTNLDTCGLFVCGITRSCISLLRSQLDAGSKEKPPHRLHRAHLFSRREAAKIFLEGNLLSREEFLDTFWMVNVAVLCLREENASLESPEIFRELTVRVPNEIIPDKAGDPSPRWFSASPSSFSYGSRERELISSLTLAP